jgi:hypothetical protein
MKIDIDDSVCDELMKARLLIDYQYLLKDIQRLEATRNLQNYQLEDLEANRKYKDAMESMMEYYIGFNWKDELP